MIPTIRITREEAKSGSIGRDTIRKGFDLYRRNGCLLLENVFSPAFIATLYASYIRRHQRFFHNGEWMNTTSVAQKRYMLQVELRSPFNNPQLYANPLVIPIIRQLLGEDFILGGFGSIVSLPGAPHQVVHWDHDALFEEDRINSIIPCYALMMFIPLIEMNKLTGTTRLYPGSHLASTKKAKRPEDPVVSIGSCLLVDYRLLHGGRANRSQQVRPILYNVYCRSWFRDTHNYDYQRPLKISEEEFHKIPKPYRKLFYLAEPSRGRASR
jgi:ectoine hydroxylase-related dioxygenase (phytanoyl-CoA dioxygenase family)